MNTVEKKGQKFELNGTIFTADTFIGENGIEYKTAIEAQINNPNTEIICVKNKENGGISAVFNSVLV